MFRTFASSKEKFRRWKQRKVKGQQSSEIQPRTPGLCSQWCATTTSLHNPLYALQSWSKITDREVESQGLTNGCKHLTEACLATLFSCQSHLKYLVPRLHSCLKLCSSQSLKATREWSYWSKWAAIRRSIYETHNETAALTLSPNAPSYAIFMHKCCSIHPNLMKLYS